ncbi:putative protein kinase [Plasmopara halstedii]
MMVNKKNRHVSKPAAARQSSPRFSETSSTNSLNSSKTTSHRRDLLDGSIQEISRQTLMERFHKRGRVESANYDQQPDKRYNKLASNVTIYSKKSSLASTGDSVASIVHWARRGPHHAAFQAQKDSLTRSHSAPNLTEQSDDEVISRIFPDICPRELRIAEVKLWDCPWMYKNYFVSSDPDLLDKTKGESLTQTLEDHELTSEFAHQNTSSPASVMLASSHQSFHATQVVADSVQNTDNTVNEVNEEIVSLTRQLSLEEKQQGVLSPHSTTDVTALEDTSSPNSATQKLQWKGVESTKRTPNSRAGKRPQLRLKLEGMPTPQQAEERAQRAATRLIAKRDAVEAAAIAAAGSISNAPFNGPSAAQEAMMRLNFSSSSETDLPSPSECERHSAGSAYSPNHGMFTTKNVAVSEAGISSPDASCLHLQENLERVKEIGRGASGVVYKAIHIPTLKVVAVKDVPVYGRGQRRQMVRELHALYSNLVPMAESDGSMPQHSATSQSTSKSKPKPSPYIVFFYDAFVDRPKNSICMVMEYMSTGSLQDIVLRGGCQNEKVLVRLATGVLHGLAHIHNKRMVHRDIKPHNLLTNRQGEVKISDFGLARTLNDSFTTTKTFVGTLLYMAPERIGGGDYSYPADIWSFGLALISVALGRYPLPTQDGFFGLVDSVTNQQCLKLPVEVFSEECRSFLDQCLTINPDKRPSAEILLQHPFILKYTAEETIAEWTSFVDRIHLCDERCTELEALSDAVYRHMYEHSVKFSHQPQSDYGVSFVSQATPAFSRRHISLQPVQMSLQLGLANHLDVPVHIVYEKFEEKRGFYGDKLLEDYCYSPQSWTASPGISRRQQFGIGSDSPQRTPSDKSSFWRKLQESMAKLGHNKRRKERGRGRSSTGT